MSSQEPTGRKRYLTYILVFLIATAFYSTATYLIFHGVSLEKIPDLSSKYDPIWFEKHNNATKPDLSYFYNLTPPPQTNETPPVSPPQPNQTTPYIPPYLMFEVYGRIPTLAWRWVVYDRYEEKIGWKRSELDQMITYSPVGTPTYSYRVRRRLLLNSTQYVFPMITLWNIHGTYVYNLHVTETNASSISELLLKETNLKKEVFVSISISPTLAYIIVEATVKGDYISSSEVIRLSSTIAETRAVVEDNSDLRYFTELPTGYLDTYPAFKNFVVTNSAGNDTKVIIQVALLFNALMENYTIAQDFPPSNEDPADWFIRNKRGPPSLFVYTLALALRAYGIPTRVVQGFIGGEYNSSTGWTEIKLNHAYVWIEVYDAGLGGWAPIDVFPLPIGARALNLVRVGFSYNFEVITPQVIQGYPSVYLNDTFTLVFTVTGIGAEELSGQVIFYDLNESAEIGRANLTGVRPMQATAILNATYQDFYSLLGKEPLYGLHIIEARWKGIRKRAIICLIRKSQISYSKTFRISSASLSVSSCMFLENFETMIQIVKSSRKSIINALSWERTLAIFGGTLMSKRFITFLDC